MKTMLYFVSVINGYMPKFYLIYFTTGAQKRTWLFLVKWTVGASIGDEKEKCSAAPMFGCGACRVCVPNRARSTFTPIIKEKSILGGYDCDTPNFLYIGKW